MKITTKEIEVSMTGAQAWHIAYHIFNSLKNSIDTHYISTHHDSYKRGFEGHAKPLLYEQEGNSIQMMNDLLSVGGGESGNRLEEELIKYFKEKYIEQNKSLDLNEKETK